MMKYLKGSDIILNLKEIVVHMLDSYSSSSCSGGVSFNIDCETRQGYCEDPDFTGTMEILEVEKKKDEENVYTLKIRFIRIDEDDPAAR